MRIFSKYLLFIAIAFFCSSMHCDDTGPKLTYDIILFYQDSSGRDLFDGTTPGHFSEDTVEFSYLGNDNKNYSCLLIDGKTDSCIGYLESNINLSPNPFPFKGNYIRIRSNSLGKLVCGIKLRKTLPIDTLTLNYSGAVLKNAYYNQDALKIPSGGGYGKFFVLAIVTK